MLWDKFTFVSGNITCLVKIRRNCRTFCRPQIWNIIFFSLNIKPQALSIFMVYLLLLNAIFVYNVISLLDQDIMTEFVVAAGVWKIDWRRKLWYHILNINICYSNMSILIGRTRFIITNVVYYSLVIYHIYIFLKIKFLRKFDPLYVL